MEIKTSKITKSVSLPGTTIENIDRFKALEELDFSSKVDVMTSDYMAIYKHSLREVGPIFDQGEIEILINACNMLILHTDELSPAILIHNAVVLYDNYFEASVTEEFQDKILHLTTAQSFAVLRVIQSYWIDKDYSRLELIMKK